MKKTPTTPEEIERRKNFERVMEYLVSAYPDTKLGLRTLEVFYDQLKHFPHWKLVSAVRAHVRDNRRFPAVSDIRALIPPSPGERPISLPPAKRVGAEEAAEAVRRVLGILGGQKP